MSGPLRYLWVPVALVQWSFTIALPLMTPTAPKWVLSFSLTIVVVLTASALILAEGGRRIPSTMIKKMQSQAFPLALSGLGLCSIAIVAAFCATHSPLVAGATLGTGFLAHVLTYWICRERVRDVSTLRQAELNRKKSLPTHPVGPVAEPESVPPLKKVA